MWPAAWAQSLFDENSPDTKARRVREAAIQAEIRADKRERRLHSAAVTYSPVLPIIAPPAVIAALDAICGDTDKTREEAAREVLEAALL